MTPPQRISLNVLLSVLRDQEVIEEFHHGDCIGADAQAHEIVFELRQTKLFEVRRVLHPPEDPKKRAFKSISDITGDVILEPLPYLVRNFNIVKATDVLIACPSQYNSVLRSGTWTTVRRARELRRTRYIIYPNGRVDHEEK